MVEQNVNKLVEAEKEARVIIDNAVTNKSSKMKDIFFYAKGDIDKFRAAQEEKYNAIMAMSQKEQLIDDEPKTTVSDLAQKYKDREQRIIDILIKNVMNVEIEVPMGLKGVDENLEY